MPPYFSMHDLWNADEDLKPCKLWEETLMSFVVALNEMELKNAMKMKMQVTSCHKVLGFPNPVLYTNEF